MEFREALIESAQKAFNEGEISRWDLFTLRVASLLPRVRDALETAVVEQAASEGVLPVGSSRFSIDWSSLLDLVRKFIPLFLELISLFR